MNKAQKTLPRGAEADVTAFLQRVPNKARGEDAFALMKMMRRVTGDKPVMWGPSIVGFGSYSYPYAGGGQGIAPKIGFSPRSNRLVIYLPLWQKDLRARLAKLGPHEASVSCLYLKRLADVDLGVLEETITAAFKSGTPFPGRKKSVAGTATNERPGKTPGKTPAKTMTGQASSKKASRKKASKRKAASKTASSKKALTTKASSKKASGKRRKKG